MYYPTLTKEYVEGIHHGRVTGELLISLEVNPNALYYLSGPGDMIPKLEETLMQMGVPQERIMYEVWWKSEQ
jgi:ferredoxin-NADP reductase